MQLVDFHFCVGMEGPSLFCLLVRVILMPTGRAFAVYMARLTETHLSLGIDEENKIFANYYDPMIGSCEAATGTIRRSRRSRRYW